MKSEPKSSTETMLELINDMTELTGKEKMALKNATNTICDFLGDMSSLEFETDMINNHGHNLADNLGKISKILAIPLSMYVALTSKPGSERIVTDILSNLFRETLLKYGKAPDTVRKEMEKAEQEELEKKINFGNAKRDYDGKLN